MGYVQRTVPLTRGAFDAADARKAPSETWDAFFLRLLLAVEPDGLQQLRETTELEALQAALTGDTTRSSSTSVSVRDRTREAFYAVKDESWEAFVLRLLEADDGALREVRVETLDLDYDGLLEQVLDEYSIDREGIDNNDESSGSSTSNTSTNDIVADGGQK